MILTAHLLTGAAIASKIQPASLALPLVFLSHYFLDCLPQKEYSIKNIREKRWRSSFFDFFKVFLDLLLGFLIILCLAGKNPFVFAAALLAAVPDASTLLYFIFSENKLLSKHWALHKKINNFGENKKISLFWKIFSQLLIILLAIFFLL